MSGPLQVLRDTAGQALRRLRYAEPAALKARWTQLVGVLAAVGVTLPGWVDARMAAGLAVWAILAPYVQGKRTRADVWSQQTVDDLTELVALFPELAGEAARLLGSGLHYRIVRGHLEGLRLRAEAHG